ncbi:MAG: Ppx/GppA family phosphatase, partial [Sphingomicrobium sp.]
MRPRKPVAIIDIGSNSVRLVVYSGAPRAPAPIFNEKVLAGLGVGLNETGRLSPEAWERALAALRRFRLLVRHMGIGEIRTVATAAVRDAANGPEFVHAIGKLGLDCQVLSAEQEAWLAGEGVLAAIPDADGIVGDLGGGSLELVEVKDGVTMRGISIPIGVIRNGDAAHVAATLRTALADSGLAQRGRGRGFYMVGGSWRALARIDMIVTGYPLPITQQYRIAPARAAELVQIVDSPDPKWAKAIAPARLASSGVAAMILAELARAIEPGALIASAFGIREGILFSSLKAGIRRQDPLIEAARYAGGGERRFGEHGDLLDRWIGGAFDDAPA